MRGTVRARPRRAVVVTHSRRWQRHRDRPGLQARGRRRHAVIGASIDLVGLHMASDRDFNRKSFTTGHTGFGVPFSVRSRPGGRAAERGSGAPLPRPLRDREPGRGFLRPSFSPTSRASSGDRPATRPSPRRSAMARELRADDIIVVQETEYTGAGKHPTAQLTFAREMGVEVVAAVVSSISPGCASPSRTTSARSRLAMSAWTSCDARTSDEWSRRWRAGRWTMSSSATWQRSTNSDAIGRRAGGELAEPRPYRVAAAAVASHGARPPREPVQAIPTAGRRPAGHRPGVPGRRVHLHPGPSGCGKSTDPEVDRRHRGGQRRADPDSTTTT